MNNTNYASFKIRYLAFLLDSALGFLFTCVIFYLVAIQPTSTAFITAAILAIALLFNPLLIYNSVLFIYYFGATPGKLLLGLRVASALQKKLTFKQILFRQTLGYMFSWTFFGLGFLAIIRDEKKQAWHDKASATVVTKKGNTFVIGLMFLILFIALSISLLVKSVQKIVKGPFVKEITKIEKEERMNKLEQIKNNDTSLPVDYDYPIQPL